MKTQKVHQEKVVRTIQPKRGNNGTLQFEDNRPKGFIQRMADATLQRIEGEEEDTLQGKFAETVQREEEEEESVQMKVVQCQAMVNAEYLRMQQQHGGGNLHGRRRTVPQHVLARQRARSMQQIRTRLLLNPANQQLPPAQLKPNNTGLPDHLKSGVENLSGYSLNDVRVHYNSPKPAQLQALAYTQGTDIHVAPGQEQHLPHEAWHVVQQMQGRVQPTMQLQGVNINDNAVLEHEADVMRGKAVVQGE